jgi:5-methylcytosine-specific restriction endonuclease McrA
VGYKNKTCLICGREYPPTAGYQKYCVACGLEVGREKKRLKSAKWAENNPGYILGWQRTNRQKCRLACEKWRKKNPGYFVGWAQVNPEKCRLSVAKQRREHPEKMVAWQATRRAEKYGNTPIEELLTSAEWLTILREARGHCSYCGGVAKLTMDHTVPLSRGGKHSKDNIVAACTHCNCSKSNRTVEEWGIKKLA